MDHVLLGRVSWFKKVHPDKAQCYLQAPTARPSAKTRRACPDTSEALGNLTNILCGDDLGLRDSSPA